MERAVKTFNPAYLISKSPVPKIVYPAKKPINNAAMETTFVKLDLEDVSQPTSVINTPLTKYCKGYMQPTKNSELKAGLIKRLK
jgi:hypothetical protein